MTCKVCDDTGGCVRSIPVGLWPARARGPTRATAAVSACPALGAIHPAESVGRLMFPVAARS